MANKGRNNIGGRGDKPAQAGKEGLKFPPGSTHWEKDYQAPEVADTRYASEFGAPEELKEQVDKLAGYVRKNKMKY